MLLVGSSALWACLAPGSAGASWASCIMRLLAEQRSDSAQSEAATRCLMRSVGASKGGGTGPCRMALGGLVSVSSVARGERVAAGGVILTTPFGCAQQPPAPRGGCADNNSGPLLNSRQRATLVSAARSV